MKNNSHDTFTWKSDFYQSIIGTGLESWISALMPQLNDWEKNNDVANQKRWQKQLNQLPCSDQASLAINNNVLVIPKDDSIEVNVQKTSSILKQFMPWRKGPFTFFSIEIDTEWRSDWKWDRVLPHIESLKDKKVLDVGCGSGYHLFRMAEAGAKKVIGVDPTSLFFYQFHCFNRYNHDFDIQYLPLGIEDLPASHYFDTVFSMGVLYHRTDPIKFLKELKAQLAPKGQLILETLVVDGDEQTVFMPTDRYAQMRNVWYLPSISALTLWLNRVGFKTVSCVDIDITSTKEQRATQWMDNHSLQDFLDPKDTSKTIEGYPRPKRAVIIAS